MSKRAQLVLGVDGFTLPLEAVTESIGIIAKRRAGKSTTARRIAEQLFHAKQHIAIVDPKGDWHGLLYARDGKGPGLPFVVLGGEHGHVDLQVGSGEVVARLVVEERVNVILDLSRFRKDDIPAFMTPFLETLYRLKAQEQYRTAMMLIIDEADAIAPQKPDRTGQVVMASAVEDLVRRGGQRGIGVMMITQRAAVLSKNVLTQIGILIVLRTIAPQDLRAMDDWISAHGTNEQRAAVMAALPTMRPGEAYVWAPGWPDGAGIFERVQMALPETFDSSSTPTGTGRRAKAPRHAAAVDLGALERRMSATIAHTKENDPRELRAALATERGLRLEAERQCEAAIVERDRLMASNRTITAMQIRTVKSLRAQIAKHVRHIAAEMRKLETRANADRDTWFTIFASADAYAATFAKAEAALEAATPPDNRAPLNAAAGVATRSTAARAGAEATAGPSSPSLTVATAAGPIGGGELLVLRAIVAAGQATREYLTVTTGYKKSTRNEYLNRLARRGYVGSYNDGDLWGATAAGIAAAGPVERPPTGPALVEWWIAKLPSGEATVLQAILGGVSDREALTDRTSFKKTTRNEYINRLVRRGLVTVDGDRLRPHAMLNGH